MRASCKDRRGNFYGGSHHYRLNQLKRQLSSPHHQLMQREMEKVKVYKPKPIDRPTTRDGECVTTKT